MKKTKVPLKTILVTSLLSSTVVAQEKQTKELERVMVIGSSDNVNDITGSATYINSEDIEQYNYTDINRVLRQVLGVNLQEEEGYGNRPNIGIRGGRSERSADITLMEDGVLIAPAPYSSPSAYYFPRVDRMEGTEVRKGSSTIKFGPRTTSGAVNLISRSIPSEGKGEATLAYGEDNTRRAQLNYGNSAGRYGYVFDLGHESTDGFKSIDAVGGDSGYSIQDLMGKFRVTSDPNAEIYQHVEFKIGATQEDSDETYLGITQEDFDNDPFRRYASTQKDNMDSDHQQYQIRHYIEPAEDWDITTTLYRNDFSRNWYKLQSVTVNGNTESLNNALNNPTYLAALKGETDLVGDDDNKLTLRANNRDYYAQGIQSNIGHQFSTAETEHELEFGIRYHYDEEDRFQQEDAYSIIDGVMTLTEAGEPGSQADRLSSANALALFIQDEINYNKWTFVPGLRYENIRLKREDRNSGNIYENDLDVFVPGLGTAYRLSENSNIFAGVHKGFAPPGPSTNTSQDPEESINYELGLRHNKNSLRIETALFFTDYENLLGEETLSSGDSGNGDQFNGGEVEVYGLEFGVKYDLAEFMNNSKLKYPVSFNYTYTHAEFQSSFSSDFDEWGDVSKGDELPYIPDHQFYVSAAIEDDKWLVSSAAKYVDEMRTVAGSGPIEYGSGTDAHLVIDLAAEYEIFKNTRVFTSIYNLTDKEYVAARRPAGARPGLPRTILAGLKYKF